MEKISGVVNVLDNEQWQNFFELYKSLPILCQSTNENYQNKYLKRKTWIELLTHYHEIVHNATLENLKNKINNIKTQYRRELRLVDESLRSGGALDDIYEPSIWFYDVLRFLKDDMTPSSAITSLDVDAYDEDTLATSEASKRKYSRPKKQNLFQERSEFLRKAVEHLQSTNSQKESDDAETYAKSWACSFRKLSAKQKIYTKNAIDEILIFGQLEKLTLSCVSPSPPSSNSTSTFQSRSCTSISGASFTTPSTAASTSGQTISHIFQLPNGMFAVPVSPQTTSTDQIEYSNFEDNY